MDELNSIIVDQLKTRFFGHSNLVRFDELVDGVLQRHDCDSSRFQIIAYLESTAEFEIVELRNPTSGSVEVFLKITESTQLDSLGDSESVGSK